MGGRGVLGGPVPKRRVSLLTLVEEEKWLPVSGHQVIWWSLVCFPFPLNY